MGSSTLLVRHLPSALTKEEKEDFLRHFGAVRVRVMGNKGPLKHTAFAEFPNKDVALQVVTKLHQVELLGCRLVVELARGPDTRHLPAASESTPNAVKEEVKAEDKKSEYSGDDQEDGVFDISFHQWGLKYRRRRKLYYLYPPPSPSILNNISNALAACPRFYVQVLHLMNKMDLPAPFGPLTAQPPLAPDVGVTVDYDRLETEEMEVSSTEESEMESETETKRPSPGVAERKRKQRESKKQIRKRARLAMALFTAPPPPPSSSLPLVTLGEVFEQSAEVGGQRRIQLRLPGSVHEPASVDGASQGVEAGGAVTNTSSEKLRSLLPVRSMSRQKSSAKPSPTVRAGYDGETGGGRSAEAERDELTATTQPSGFGVITPVAKPAVESEDNDEDEGWAETKFVSRSELRKGRLSHREMEDVSVFRNYKEGEPSRRLYIKNLAKQATEEDLHWIFGRYVNWDDEAEKNIFDIRLMKEGRMKGQAFVTLGRQDQAVKAVRDTNAFVFKGKPMAVLFARSAKQQEDGKT